MKPVTAAAAAPAVWAVYASDDSGPSALFRALSERVALRSVLATEDVAFFSRRSAPPQSRTRLRVLPWGAPLQRSVQARILKKQTRGARAVIFTRPDQEVHTWTHRAGELLALIEDAERAASPPP